jgi:ComF family protein
MPLKIDGIRSVVLFEGGVRQAIHRLKYRNQTVLAKPLAQLMADYWDESPMPADLLIPVPLQSARHRQRGYNQADLLARELGRIIDLPVQTTGLQRTRDTKSQMSLSVSDRVQNMREAFVYQPHKRQNGSGVSGKHVLVIDDVCTTGATLEACSVSLKSAGAFDVWGFTLARAILATDK